MNASLVDQLKSLKVIDEMGEIIFQTDAVGNWTFLNQAWERITGFTVAESLGKNFINSIHPEDQERTWHLFEPLVKREKEYCRSELRYVTKDGGFVWVEVYGLLTVGSNNEIIGTSGSIRNVTKWRELTHQKSENELWFKSVFNNTYQGMCLLNPDGRIIEVNEQTLTFIGMPEEKVKGKFFWELTKDEKQVRRQQDILYKALQGDFVRYELQIKQGVDGPVHFDCSMKPIKNENGIIVLLIAEVRNITNLKKIEAELKRSLEKEKELNELKSRFISIASHQFRTPLAGIQSSLDIINLILSKGLTDVEQVQKYLGRVQSDISRMTALMNDVLMMEQVTGGNVDVDEEPVNLLSIVNDMVEVYYNQERGCEVNVRVRGTPRKITTDQRLLWHILQNLIDNALKYSDKPPSVLVVFSAKIFVVVEDKGIGIAPNDLEYVFEPFFRAKNASDQKGTGLGLAIVKEFVKLINAKIEVRSTLNEGTRFRITLP